MKFNYFQDNAMGRGAPRPYLKIFDSHPPAGTEGEHV